MLSLQHVSLTFSRDEPVLALDDISFDFRPQRLYVVTGPNGAGKSSLAKVLMGIYKPTSGLIQYNDQDIAGLSVTEHAKLGIGYSFQHPPRFKGIKVHELISLAASGKPDFFSLFNQVGLCTQDYINRDVDATLSGGEIKRIEIATVLARNLTVAVFDEPEAGIDLWSFQRLAETFKTMHQQRETIIIIISHQERIIDLADEVILMVAGRIDRVFSAHEIQAGLLKSQCICGSDCGKGVGHDAQLPGHADA